MTWNVEHTDEFGEWWQGLTDDVQESVDAIVLLLRQLGPQLPFPYSSKISSSSVTHLRELRIQHRGNPYRILYAFDPRRAAILLIGGNKKGDDRWYETFIPIAERLYTDHLKTMRGK
jgi:hypothetical protein